LEILQPTPVGGKGIGELWETTVKDDRTQGWHFAAGGIKRLISAWVSGSMKNRGVIIQALGSRPESFDAVSSITLRVTYHAAEVCARIPGWCTHAGSTYTQVDCDSDGILDHVCTDAQHAGVIRPATGCQSEWPNVDLIIACPGAIGIVMTQIPPIVSHVDGQFSTGFATKQPSNGWSYWSNIDSPLGNWHEYTELKYNGARNGYDSTGRDTDGSVLIAADGGKSGAGTSGQVRERHHCSTRMHVPLPSQPPLPVLLCFPSLNPPSLYHLYY